MDKPPLNDVHLAWDLSRVRTHCELIGRDVRSFAECIVPRRYVDEATAAIQEHNLRYRCFPCGKDHIEIMIFRHPHLAIILQGLRNLSIKKDPALYHWCWGRAFGYSEEQIGQFLFRQGLM